MGIFSGLTSTLGFGPRYGEYYQPSVNPTDNMLSEDMMRSDAAVRTNQDTVDYGMGGMSLQDLLRGWEGKNSMTRSGLVDQLALNPLSGSRLASDQVRMDPILGKLFGAGGSMEGAAAEEKDLMGRGYKLQPEDYEAYGQTSGDIARMFGQGEKDLSASLAMRGLAGSNNLAGSQFSGLQGNKMEMLAKAQTDIANKRMENNMQRLNSTRQYLGGLGSLGNQAIGDQFGRNMSGIQAQMNARNNMYQNLSGNYKTNQALAMESQKDKKENMNKNIFDAAGEGLYSGVQSGVAQRTKSTIGGGGGGFGG